MICHAHTFEKVVLGPSAKDLHYITPRYNQVHVHWKKKCGIKYIFHNVQNPTSIKALYFNVLVLTNPGVVHLQFVSWYFYSAWIDVILGLMFALAVHPYKVEDKTSLATEGDRMVYSSKSSTLNDAFKATLSSNVCNGHSSKSILNNSPFLNCRGEFGFSLGVLHKNRFPGPGNSWLKKGYCRKDLTGSTFGIRQPLKASFPRYPVGSAISSSG